MVYESDFYTTRRPYSRPLVTSYSVTRPIIIPFSNIIQLRSTPHMPYIAHKRLVTIIHTPIHHVYYAGAMIPIRIRARVRPSVLAAELNRIRDLPRLSTRSYIDEYLNSRNNILFDDETREIRARVDSLLRRIHVFVPRAVASDFVEEIVPERMRSHDYVRRLLSGRNNAKKDVEYLSWYEVPDRGSFGTLACVKYVAGKPQSIRKPYFKITDLRPIDIRNDVNFLSYYSKNRQAAATASSNQPMTEREIRKARALDIESTYQEEKINTKQEKELKKIQLEKESEPIEKFKSIPELINESSEKLIPEPAKLKLTKSIKSGKLEESVKVVEVETEPALETEFIKESVNISESVQESEPVAKMEPIIDSKESEVSKEVAEDVVSNENIDTKSVSEVENEKPQKVKQEKEDAIKRVEKYLAKTVQEAQSEEERQKAAEEEHLQLEAEERKAWEALQLAQEQKAELCQILETERKEAERKAEEMQQQAEREEVEKIEESERIINQAKLSALIQEQERLIVEEHLEEIQQQKQEQEAIDITQFSAEPKDVSCIEDLADQGDMTDQEKEEKLYDVTINDETRVEEENILEEVHIDEKTEDTFVEEPIGIENKQMGPMAIEINSQIEEITSGEEFEWGDQDA